MDRKASSQVQESDLQHRALSRNESSCHLINSTFPKLVLPTILGAKLARTRMNSQQHRSLLTPFRLIDVLDIKHFVCPNKTLINKFLDDIMIIEPPDLLPRGRNCVQSANNLGCMFWDSQGR
jgi:hypothetical protein